MDVESYLLGILTGMVILVSFVASIGAYMYYCKPKRIVHMFTTVMFQRPKPARDAVRHD